MASSASKWTPAQQRAISTTGHSLLVSAAAGSGKTAVLAERSAHLVCDANEPCAVDELLVVTFTNAAASEMRERIEAVLRKRLENDDDPRLARQLALIDRAQISTLHGFCSRVIKQNFHLVGIDPAFITLAQEEADLLRDEVASQLFADHYAGANAAEFQKFVDLYGDGNDDAIIRRLMHTHDLLSSMRDPHKWLNRAVGRIKEAIAGDLGTSELGRELTRLIQTEIGDLRRRAIEASRRLGEMPELGSYAEYVNDLLGEIQNWQDSFGAGDFDALAKAVSNFKAERLPNTRGLDEATRDIGKAILETVREPMKTGTIIEITRFNLADWCDGLARIAGPSKMFLDLALEFSKRYQKAKEEIHSIDFSDLERLALKILRDKNHPDRMIPTAAARAYHAEFKHVLVDEYQDINGVQDAILTLISKECLLEDDNDAPCFNPAGPAQNFFCVGDVKQSIYRFRLADPQLFLGRDGRFRKGDPRLGQVIDLQANFRTRGPLIDVINGVFERLMTAESAELLYDDSHKLHAGLKYPPGTDNCFTGAPVELHLLPGIERGEQPADDDNDELDRSQREAVIIAQRIRQLMGFAGAPRKQVYDKSINAMRDLRYRDMVILLRSMKVKADQFADQLRLADIPVHSESGVGFFESMEVRDILSLLRLLDNQRQDIPMAAVLRSPLAKLPNAEDCLAKVRLAVPGYVPFHEAVVRYSKAGTDEIAASLRGFLKELEQWRDLAHQRPLAEVLWHIYDTTGYLAFCAGLEDGEQRVANLISLHERARQFGTFQRQGLGRFMQFIKNLQEQSDLGQPSVASEADDVVKIMSVHRSKGLEFPVVFLPDLGKRHNLADCRGIILVDRQAYIGMQAVDEAKRVRYPSLPWVLAQDRLKKQMLAEELRVLYVAMTRAREHLILIGTCDQGPRDAWRDWIGHAGALPADVVLGGNTMLDWIGPVAHIIEASNPGSFEITLHDDADIQALAVSSSRRNEMSDAQKLLVKLVPLDPAPPRPQEAQQVIDRLTTVYPFDAYSRLPAVASVSGLTKTGRAAPGGQSESRTSLVAFDIELPAPRCVAVEQKATATEIGSATHLALEHLDFTRAARAKDIEHQLEAMVGRKLLSANDRAMVDVVGIAWLVGTELGEILIAHHAHIRRELPVYFTIDAPTSFQSGTVIPARADPMDQVMIRGRLDVMVPLADGLLVADYKTDRVTEQTVDARVGFYQDQIASYADAIAKITGQPVTHRYLAFLAPRILRKV